MGLLDVVDLVMQATDDMLFEAEAAVEEGWYGSGDFNPGQQVLVDEYAFPATLDYVDGAWPDVNENEFLSAAFSSHPDVQQALSDTAQNAWYAVYDVRLELAALKMEIGFDEGGGGGSAEEASGGFDGDGPNGWL